MRRHDQHRLRAELLDAQQRLAELLKLLPDVWPELIDGLPGYPTSTTGSGSAPRLAADGTPAGLDRYLIGPNPAAEDMRTLQQAAFTASTAIRTGLDIAHRWLATVPVDEPRRSSGTDCQVCARWVAGTDHDRLRAGLCMACYQDWRRSLAADPWLERSIWAHQRRQRLADEPQTVA